MKKTIAKYNGAFGYIKAYLFVAGAFGGIAGIIGAILAPFGSKATDENPLTVALSMIGTALLALLIAFAMYAWAKKKCPAGMEKTLLRDMILVGLFAAVFCAILLAVWIFKLIFHMNSSSVSTQSGGTQTGNFASGYCPVYGEEQYLYLVSDNGTYAVLRDEKGNDITVYPHNDNIVKDEAGNLYRPR